MGTLPSVAAAPAVRRKRVAPAAGRWPVRDLSKHSVEHFGKFFATLRMPDGAGKRVLQDFQLAKLEDFFSTWEADENGVMVPVRQGFFENLWLEPTGQGKSTLFGALALHHGTYVREDPRVFVLGGLGDQAQNTMSAAAGFIKRSSDLSQWWKATTYGLGRITSLHPDDVTDGKDPSGIIASSAGRRVGGRAGASQEGKAPTLILVEEFHRHEDNGGALATLISKTQKRSASGLQVQVVHGTTAGDDLDSPLGLLVKRATNIEDGAEVRVTEAWAEHAKGDSAVVDPDLRPGEFYRRAVDGDRELVMHEWAVPDSIRQPGQDANREQVDAYLALVKRANPADMVTVRSLRFSWRSLKAMVHVFLRQHANQWVTQDFAAIDRFGLNKGRHEGLKIPKGRELERMAQAMREDGYRAKRGERNVVEELPRVYVGLDMADKWDRTAITPVWVDPESGRPRCTGAVILGSSAPGVQRRARNVIGVLEQMREVWPQMAVVFDRASGGNFIAEQFEEDYGLDVVDFNQNGAPMELASMLLGELINQGGWDHDGQPDLTAHLLAAVMRKSSYGKRWRFEKPRSGKPIDGAAAAAMATYMALNPPPPKRRSINLDDLRIRQL